MLARSLLSGAVAVALLAGPAAAAAKPKPEPELTVEGRLVVTSTLTTVCPKPGYGRDVVVTEKAITIRTYTFSGSSGDPGRMTSRGEETYETDTKVSGDTDLLTDQHLGPVKKVIPGFSASFSSVFQKAQEGKGRHRRDVLRFDLTALTGSGRSGSMPMPRRGGTLDHFLEPSTKGYKDRPNGPCTASDQTHTSGNVTVTRR